MTKRTFEPYELLVRPRGYGFEWGLDITPIRAIVVFDKRYNALMMQCIFKPAKHMRKIKEGIKYA